MVTRRDLREIYDGFDSRDFLADMVKIKGRVEKLNALAGDCRDAHATARNGAKEWK
jgi:hypothetical protein